ncbi:unnamed protein product [Colias eurytheme]|nr:unnamed protein product [Colias eurytheme]
MYWRILLLQLFGVFCYEYEGYGRNNIGNVARRDIIPLHELVKRRRDNVLNYRRTKDIRSDVNDRRFEISEAQFKEALWKETKAAEDKERLDRLHRELRWLTINSNELGIGYK